MSSVDRQKFETDFQRDSNKVFKENVEKYNDNDITYLRKLRNLYGDAMNAKGLNIADPFEANMFHYNKLGFKGNVDHPRVSKTYVFFTRPELNFSQENINSVPFFKWLYAQDIGKMIMASLTDPDYFINAPTAFNTQKFDEATFLDYINQYEAAAKKFESDLAESSDTTDKYKTYALSSDSKAQDYSALESSDDDADDVAELQALDLESLDDSSAIATLSKNAASIASAYPGFYKSGGSADIMATALSFKNRNAKGTNNQFLERLQNDGLYQAKSTIFSSDPDVYWNTTPFIPLLSNVVTSLDGARDLSLEQYTYEEDEHGSTLSVATGMDGVWKEGDFSTSIEDILYSPAALMFMCWIFYIHYVSRGYIMPTREHITERILDYTCSAYVFVIGEDGKRIERFGKYTGCYPASFPLSSQLIHNTQLDIDMLHKFSVSWHYNRYTAMDPQIFTDFNFISETEWLVKLKDPLWENLYTRSTLKDLTKSFEDLQDVNSQLVESIGRPTALWDAVTVQGMSGRLPAGIVPSSESPNNFWGGYPYIRDGREFIWVQPTIMKITDQTDTITDEDTSTT